MTLKSIFRYCRLADRCYLIYNSKSTRLCLSSALVERGAGVFMGSATLTPGGKLRISTFIISGNTKITRDNVSSHNIQTSDKLLILFLSIHANFHAVSVDMVESTGSL